MEDEERLLPVSAWCGAYLHCAQRLAVVDFYEADRKGLAPFVPGSRWATIGHFYSLEWKKRIDDATAPNFSNYDV